MGVGKPTAHRPMTRIDKNRGADRNMVDEEAGHAVRQVGRGCPDPLFADEGGHIDDGRRAQIKASPFFERRFLALADGVAHRGESGGVIGHSKLYRPAE